MEINRIKVFPPFSDLFPIDQRVLKAVKEDMKVHGFDRSQAIIIWNGTNVVIDGHTRLKAAHELGMVNVPVTEKRFSDEGEALLYAIHNQRDRRNLTQEDLCKVVAIVDEICKRGEGQGRESGKFQPKAPGDAIGKSAKKTADIVGSSQATVERVSAAPSDPEVAEEVKAGKLSINQGAKKARAKKVKPPKATAPTPTPEEAQSIVAEQDKRQEVLMQAWTELRAWRQKYNEFQELSELFEVLDKNYLTRFKPGHSFSDTEESSLPGELEEPCASRVDCEREGKNFPDAPPPGVLAEMEVIEVVNAAG